MKRFLNANPNGPLPAERIVASNDDPSEPDEQRVPAAWVRPARPEVRRESVAPTASVAPEPQPPEIGFLAAGARGPDRRGLLLGAAAVAVAGAATLIIKSIADARRKTIPARHAAPRPEIRTPAVPLQPPAPAPGVSVRRGEMDNESFYSSAVSSGFDDSVVSEIVRVLSFDFDFQREVRAGDQFEAVYGPSPGQGPAQLMYAALITPFKQRGFYRFETADGAVGWFDSGGRSNIKSLLRTPVAGARISSTFGWRVHPIQGFLKHHNGVDFAVPVGTPVLASGDATVEWAAMKGPNGNLVILRHDNGWESYYLHLSGFGDGVAPERRVHQGQVIGLSGQTGAAAGPHLHYELHIAQEPVDPMTVKLDEGRALQGMDLDRFHDVRDAVDRARASAL